MGKWRVLFESNLPPVEQREYGEEYEFGRPATAGQIATAEQALGARLPADVREMLSEFNGMWSTSAVARKHGHSPSIAFLDIEHMTVDVPRYFANCGNTLPPKEDLCKVVWVAQSNGFSYLWGVCVEDVAGHKAGAVVRMDHEVGDLEACQPSLAEFVRVGRHHESK
jgi:hypothetical protein